MTTSGTTRSTSLLGDVAWISRLDEFAASYVAKAKEKAEENPPKEKDGSTTYMNFQKLITISCSSEVQEKVKESVDPRERAKDAAQTR